MNFPTFTFQGFRQLFRNTYFEECILVSAFVICFIKVIFTFCQRLEKSGGLLHKVQNVLPRMLELFVRVHYDHGYGIMVM